MKRAECGALVAAGLLAGLATPALAATQPPTGDTAGLPAGDVTPIEALTPLAQITFAKGYEAHIGMGAVQRFSISESGSCADLRLRASLLWTTKNTSSATLPTGRPVLLLVSTGFAVSRGGYQLSTPHCEVTGTFSPLPGHHYRATVLASYGSECSLLLRDQTAGGAPPDLTTGDGAACLREAVRADVETRRARTVVR